MIVHQLKCNRCNLDYELGFAIFVDPDKAKVRWNYNHYDDLVVVECLKCPKCGQSEFLDR